MPNTQRRLVIIWSLAALALIAVAFWRYSGVPFPELQLRILVVVFGTMAGVMNLYRGILLGFSRYGGWRAASVPLLWAAVALLISYDALEMSRMKGQTPYLMILAAVLAITASVITLRNQERAALDSNARVVGGAL